MSCIYWKKNSDSGGGVTNFRNQAWTCTRVVHVISRLISLISRLMFSLVGLYFLYSRLILATEFCQSSRLIIPYTSAHYESTYSRLISALEIFFSGFVSSLSWIQVFFSPFYEAVLIVLLKFWLD